MLTCLYDFCIVRAMETQHPTHTAQVTDSSVSWASSTPLNVPAYVTGEWGEYVTTDGGFSPDIKDAKVLTPTQQRVFAANHKGVMRFRDAVRYGELLRKLDEGRGF